MSDTYRDQPPAKPTCQQCNVALVPIRVVDHAHGGLFVGLAYTVEEAPETSMWTGAVKNAAGIARAYACPRCRLIAWYAHPGEQVQRA